MKKVFLTVIAVTVLLSSLLVTICSYPVRADSTDSINFLDSALTIFSPVNMTYNNRHLTLNLNVPVWSIMGMPNNVSMNYTVDGIYSGPVPLRNITPSDAPPIATKVGMGAGYVDLPELPDGSHYITINLYGLNMLNYNPQFKSFVYTVCFSIDDPNSTFIPTPAPTPSPTSFSTLTVSLFESASALNFGNRINFTVSVEGGNAPFTYAWYIDGELVENGTSPHYTTDSQAVGSHHVYVEVKDADNNTAKTLSPEFNVLPSLTYNPSSSISPTQQPTTEPSQTPDTPKIGDFAPVIIPASIVILAIVVVGSLFYFKKRRG